MPPIGWWGPEPAFAAPKAAARRPSANRRERQLIKAAAGQGSGALVQIALVALGRSSYRSGLSCGVSFRSRNW
jgi:hypothetical protein